MRAEVDDDDPDAPVARGVAAPPWPGPPLSEAASSGANTSRRLKRGVPACGACGVREGGRVRLQQGECRSRAPGRVPTREAGTRATCHADGRLGELNDAATAEELDLFARQMEVEVEVEEEAK